MHIYTILSDACVQICHAFGLNNSTTTNNNNHHFMALCPVLPGWAEPVLEESNIHPLAPLLIINILYQLPPSTTIHSILPFNLRAWQSFAQPLSKSSLVYLLVWNLHFILHTFPYISSTNHCLLSTTHAHTITTCFAVVPRFCLFLVSILTLSLELLTFT